MIFLFFFPSHVNQKPIRGFGHNQAPHAELEKPKS